MYLELESIPEENLMAIFNELICEMIDKKVTSEFELSWNIQKMLICKDYDQNGITELPFHGFSRNWRASLIKTYHQQQLLKYGKPYCRSPIEIIEVHVIGTIEELLIGKGHPFKVHL